MWILRLLERFFGEKSRRKPRRPGSLLSLHVHAFLAPSPRCPSCPTATTTLQLWEKYYFMGNGPWDGGTGKV